VTGPRIRVRHDRGQGWLGATYVPGHPPTYAAWNHYRDPFRAVLFALRHLPRAARAAWRTR